MISIPFLAVGVDLLAWSDDLASSIVESVPFIALLADTHILVEQFALGTDLAADALDVEKVVLGAF
jgi:hypothetical protein